MSEELRELYQEVILDHNKSPRNYRAIDDANCRATGKNPLCGDSVVVYAKVEDGIIQDISFQGLGCAISKSSASLMTTELKGKSIDEAHEIFNTFHDMVTGDPSVEADADQLGKMVVFAGVREYPARVKCASLAWHTIEAALRDQKDPVSTE